VAIVAVAAPAGAISAITEIKPVPRQSTDAIAKRKNSGERRFLSIDAITSPIHPQRKASEDHRGAPHHSGVDEATGEAPQLLAEGV
jgi:hypothetical protein